jgi:hypothetical protein
MVEFVSANPTGPLHIGHGRQAALGDAISELLAWTGWRCSASSTTTTPVSRSRGSRAASGRATSSCSAADVRFPEDGYHGELRARDRARAAERRLGDRWVRRRRRGARCDARLSPSIDCARSRTATWSVPRPLRPVLPRVVAVRRGPGEETIDACGRPARLREGRRALAAHHGVRRRQGPGHGQERTGSRPTSCRTSPTTSPSGSVASTARSTSGRRPPRHHRAGARRGCRRSACRRATRSTCCTRWCW